MKHVHGHKNISLYRFISMPCTPKPVLNNILNQVSWFTLLFISSLSIFGSYSNKCAVECLSKAFPRCMSNRWAESVCSSLASLGDVRGWRRALKFMKSQSLEPNWVAFRHHWTLQLLKLEIFKNNVATESCKRSLLIKFTFLPTKGIEIIEDERSNLKCGPMLSA